MLIDITPQEMQAICAGIDLLKDYIDDETEGAEHLKEAALSLQKKALYIADQSKQMHTAIMDRTEVL